MPWKILVLILNNSRILPALKVKKNIPEDVYYGDFNVSDSEVKVETFNNFFS